MLASLSETSIPDAFLEVKVIFFGLHPQGLHYRFTSSLLASLSETSIPDAVLEVKVIFFFSQSKKQSKS